MNEASNRRSLTVPQSERRQHISTASTTGKVLPSLAWYCLLFYFALLCVPIEFNVVTSGLDASWGFALNYLFNHNIVFGPEVIFTYGPLGFVATPHHIGNNLTIALAIRAVTWIVLLLSLASFWHRGFAFAAVALTVSGIAANRLLSTYWDYMLCFVLLVLSAHVIVTGLRSTTAVVLSCMLGIAFLVKFTVFVMGMAVMAIYISGRLIAADVNRKDGVLMLLVASSAVIAYLLYNPSLSGLGQYIAGALQISNGFNAAMSWPATDRDLLTFAGLCSVLGACLVIAVMYAGMAYTSAVSVAVVTWVGFKHGFVRGDVWHAAMFASFSIIAFGFFLALLRPNGRTRALAVCTFGVVAALGLTGTHARWPVLTLWYWSPEQSITKIQRLLRWNITASEMRAASQTTTSTSSLVEYEQLIKGRSILIFPWELSYGANSTSRLVPLYAMQAYSAYTHYLDRRTAEPLRNVGSTTPEFILLEWKAIDGRHPLLDTPETANAMFQHYEPASVSAGSLLLKRRATPLDLAFRRVSEARMSSGTWTTVPRYPVSASIDLEPTLTGTVANTLLSIPAMFLEFQTAGGVVYTYRVPPDVLRGRFPLNWIATDIDELSSIWRDGTVKSNVVAVRLHGSGMQYFKDPKLTIWGVDGLAVKLPVGAEQQSGSFHVNLKAMQASAADMGGVIDNAGPNGQPPRINDAAAPLVVRANDGFRMAGWFVIGDASNGRPPDELYAVTSSGAVVQATRVRRPDVADHFRNPALKDCGYSLVIPSDKLTGESQKVTLYGFMATDKSYHKFPTELYVRLSVK